MNARWKHDCTDCVLIEQSIDCDIYQCGLANCGDIVFRRSEDDTCRISWSDLFIAAKAVQDIEDAQLESYRKNNPMPDEGIM